MKMIKEINIDGKVYELREKNTSDIIEVKSFINGTQRSESRFNSVDELFKYLKRKHTIIFNKNLDTFGLQVKWVKE